jgi:glycosyltransferase involved in cell wall biosynthesis
LREAFPYRPQRSLDAGLERRVVNGADVVLGATRPIADDLGDRFDVDAVWLTNGWDPAEPVEARGSSRATVEGTGFSLVYTGTLRIRGFDPAPLLDAIRNMRREGFDLRLVIAGRLTAADRGLITQFLGAEGVDLLGVLGRGDALALQRSSDALLLVSSRDRSVATSKLFEYLGARRPIVALAEGNEVARIVRETGTGVTVSPDDVEAIGGALRLAVTGQLRTSYAPRELDTYIYPAPAERLAELVEVAIERHRRRVIKQASD